MEDEYWAKLCRTCPPDDPTHTNRECVERIAEQVRMPVEEALKVFRPRPDAAAAHTEWTEWAKHDKETRANG